MEFVVVHALWPIVPTHITTMNFGLICISVIRMREDIKYYGSDRKLNDTLFYFCVRIVLSINSIWPSYKPFTAFILEYEVSILSKQ